MTFFSLCELNTRCLAGSTTGGNALLSTDAGVKGECPTPRDRAQIGHCVTGAGCVLLGGIGTSSFPHVNLGEARVYSRPSPKENRWGHAKDEDLFSQAIRIPLPWPCARADLCRTGISKRPSLRLRTDPTCGCSGFKRFPKYCGNSAELCFPELRADPILENLPRALHTPHRRRCGRGWGSTEVRYPSRAGKL
jgi:hypothetical protein